MVRHLHRRRDAAEVPTFDVTSLTSTGFTARHWAYDTETGIDKMTFRIGTTPGGTDVMPETEVFPENPVVTRTGLTIPKYSTVQARYTNGANLTTTVTRASLPLAADSFVRDGTYVNKNFGESPYVTAQNSSVGSNRRGYLKLDISSITGNVSKVTLRFAAVRLKAGSGLLEFLPTSSAWTQSGIRWSNAPAATGPARRDEGHHQPRPPPPGMRSTSRTTSRPSAPPAARSPRSSSARPAR